MLKKTLKYLTFILLIFQFSNFLSQTSVEDFQTPFSSNINYTKNPSSQFSFTGYYRFLGFVRNQKEVFPNNSGKTLAIPTCNHVFKSRFNLSSLFQKASLFNGQAEHKYKQASIDFRMNRELAQK